MPTAYSTNLRLALPATGENAGTWGAIVNNNITSMIEQAVSGTASIVMTDADVTLTFNAGISDQARNAILSITSSVSLTATRNIIAPTGCAKAYTIYNGTTGGQALVIKTSGGTASVTIANGATTQVFTPDGVNFFTAIGGLISGLTAGNATNATNATTLTGATVWSVPYQSAAGVTSYLAPSTTGYLLQTNNASAPTWVNPATLTVSTATNVNGGGAGQILYQSAANTTGFSAAGSSGNILVSGGTGAPTWTATPSVTTLSATGTITAATFNATSDERMKNNVREMRDAANIVSSLRGVRFNWASDGAPSAGLIAQDLERVLPEVVTTNEDGYKSVNYNGVVGVLIEALKDATRRIERLEARK